jgi:hypothetical protein
MLIGTVLSGAIIPKFALNLLKKWGFSKKRKFLTYIWVQKNAFFSECALGEKGTLLLRVNVGTLFVW